MRVAPAPTEAAFEQAVELAPTATGDYQKRQPAAYDAAKHSQPERWRDRATRNGQPVGTV